MKNEQNSCPNLTYIPEQQYNWVTDMNENFSLVSKAHAQTTLQDLTTGTGNLLSIPLYILVIVFMFFTVTMSLIYLYHWVKFNLNDPFIKNFSIVYFAGLCFLIIPLIFNLIN